MIAPGRERVGPLTWYVAIQPAAQTRNRLGHVFAFAFDGLNWIVVDPHLRFTETYSVPAGPMFDAWRAEATAGCEVFKLPGRRHARVFAGMFCVGVIKRLVGLNSGAFTPGGLRRDLIRAGAKKVFDEGQGPQGRSGAEGVA